MGQPKSQLFFRKPIDVPMGGMINFSCLADWTTSSQPVPRVFLAVLLMTLPQSLELNKATGLPLRGCPAHIG
jgi:hypothetical protein